ncbi:MAG: hypothetical protein VX278_17535, partial [Myxococcota bacterium]|nr:hypothetical protein [Myxococcota bacterium]
PDISPVQCTEQEIPNHIHDQGLIFLNLTNTALYSFGDGWQASLMVPFQVRLLRIDYYLADNQESYTPPYAGIHHRNESLIGLGDFEVSAQRLVPFGRSGLGVSVGTTIPVGRIEENPYDLGAESKEHQHIQMGTGAFVPLLEVVAFHPFQQSGLLGRVRFEIPFYENTYRYQSGRAVRWSAGYWRTLFAQSVGFIQIQGTHESSDEWYGIPAPFSGRDAVGLALSGMWRVQDDRELILRVERNVWERPRNESDRGEDESLPPFWVFSFGLSWL